MKKVKLILGSGLITGALFLASCDKLSKEEALELESNLQNEQDSLNRVTGDVRYSVHVYAANQASGKKEGTTAVSGVSVTVDQDGVITTKTTDDKGFAVFPNLKAGNAVVLVSASGYTRLRYKTDLRFSTADPTNTSYTNRQISTIVPIFALSGANNTATITGMAYIETDLTNTTKELAPAGSLISAYIDANDGSFINQYFNNTNSDAGEIQNAAYDSVYSSATVAADGSYTLTVPASVDGLPIELYIHDVVANQSLVHRYLEGDINLPTTLAAVRTVRTVFSVDGNSIGDANIPNYSSVVGSIAAPATQGSGATFALKLVARSIDNGNGFTVINAGSGYGASLNNIPVTITGGDFDNTVTGATQATLTANSDANGRITSINVTTAGLGYRSRATITIGGAGTGAIVRNDYKSAVAAVTSNNASLTGSTITNGGSNYFIAPTIYYQDSLGVNENAGSATVSAGVITNIPYTGNNNFVKAPTARIVIATSSQATANASVNSDGTVSVAMTSNGSGYNPASIPSVTFTSLVSTQPTIVATGYANVSSGGTVSGIVITNPGSGYAPGNANYPSSFQGVNWSTSSIWAKPGSVHVVDINYGTGYHTRRTY